MANKKKNIEVNYCTPYCPYFPQQPTEIISEEKIDGVIHRKTIRTCNYDSTVIKEKNLNNHICPRKNYGN